MKRLASDERGQVAVLAALLITVVAGAGALAVDASAFYLNKNKLQAAADAAALGAARYLGDPTSAASAAISLAAKNVPSSYGSVLSATDVVIGTWNKSAKTFTASITDQNAIKVTTRSTVANGNASPTYLAQILGHTSQDITATAIAVRNGPTACLYALDRTASPGFSVGGGGSVSVPNCGIQVNSSALTAATASNNTTVKAQSISIAGNYTGSTWSPVPTTGASQLNDPLSGVPEPTMPSTCSVNNTNSSSNQTLTPDVTYCGDIKFTGQASVFLPAGIYYFKGSTVKILNNASLTGSGVMIYLDENSTIDFSTNGTTHLSAPTSGPYQGILIFQSRSAPTTAVNKVAGSPTLTLDGTIYTPTTTLAMTGSGDISVNTKAGYLIANRFSYSGSVTFTFDNYSNNAPPKLSSRGVLVN